VVVDFAQDEALLGIAQPGRGKAPFMAHIAKQGVRRRIRLAEKENPRDIGN